MIPRSEVIENCRAAARRKGGVCLSVFRKKRQWFARCRCERGHRWAQRAYYIIRGQWCWACAHFSEKATPAYMQELAASRGGRFLSKGWRGTGVKHSWQCALGHMWQAKPNSITQGRWCPECSGRLSERICRAYFERIFRTKFSPAWPIWLTNARGFRMELDGFSKKLSLAFEFQGVQHYRATRFFHQRDRTIALQRTDDRRKRTLCRRHGITLIQVPYKLSHEGYPKFIGRVCAQAGIPIPTRGKPFRIDLGKAFSPDHLAPLRKIATSRRGELLSTAFLGNKGPLEWKCTKGHTWEAIPTSIQRGSWCPLCASRRKWRIEDIVAWAAARSLRCSSKVYTHNRQRLIWLCKKGHSWQAQWNSVRIGSRCPDCAGTRKKTIGEVQKLAGSRGWKCTSKIYIGADRPLRFLCAKEHAIKKTWTQLRLGIRCHLCLGSKERSLAAVRAWATRRGRLEAVSA